MKKILLYSLLSITFLCSCESNDDGARASNNTTEVPIDNQIKTFIYNVLNTFYLYKDESPNLANDRFSSQSQLDSFINQAGSPESLFENLTVSQDRFSFIFNDYEVLENFFQGVSLSTGMKFNLNEQLNNTNLYIVVTDVVANSPASNAGITRGMIFNRVNGEQLTNNNSGILFRSPSFTIGQAMFNENNDLINLSNEVFLNAIELTENPVAVTQTIQEAGHTIGYLQYNSFVFDFEEQLNDAFAEFKNNGVTDFVLDLRYNGGGAIITANALCGMITGQFEGQVFSRRQWNDEIQEFFETEAPEDLVDPFVGVTAQNNTPLNSLGLNKVYIITSKNRTASSSELVINSLKAYIDVVVIGSPEGTVGKSQASNTFYDSPNFRRENLNANHKYVLQPLIFRTTNSNNNIVPNSGIFPTSGFEAEENDRNLGILGDPEEPLFKIAIDDITGRSTLSAKTIVSDKFGEIIGNESMYAPNYQRMYIDTFLNKKNVTPNN